MDPCTVGKKTLHTTITMAYWWQHFRDSSTSTPCHTRHCSRMLAHSSHFVISVLNYIQIITIACCPHSRLQVGLLNPSKISCPLAAVHQLPLPLLVTMKVAHTTICDSFHSYPIRVFIHQRIRKDLEDDRKDAKYELSRYEDAGLMHEAVERTMDRFWEVRGI